MGYRCYCGKIKFLNLSSGSELNPVILVFAFSKEKIFDLKYCVLGF